MTFKFISGRASVTPSLCFALGLVALSAAGALVACSDDDAPATGANAAAGAAGNGTEGGGAAGNDAGGAAGQSAAGAGGSAGATNSGALLGTADCDTCLGTSCGDARTACAADESCVTCVNEGDDAACHVTPETHERADAVLSCQGSACKAACFGATGGGACKDKIAGACGTCLEGACCDEVAACFANEHCDACVRTGKESVCHEDAAGHALFHALSKCLAASCSDDCN